jgi:hypothetical protein
VNVPSGFGTIIGLPAAAGGAFSVAGGGDVSPVAAGGDAPAGVLADSAAAARTAIATLGSVRLMKTPCTPGCGQFGPASSGGILRSTEAEENSCMVGGEGFEPPTLSV